MYLIVAFCLFVGLAIYGYLKNRNEVFKRMGIAHPEPTLGIGNVGSFYNKVPSEVLREWGRELGPTFGYMEGGRPVIVSSDPDFLHQVFVKQFSNFHGRKEFPLAPDPDKDARVNVFGARGARWKRLRTISTPIFTASKMRQMQPFVHGSLDEFIGLLDEKATKGESFDILPYFQRLTLDVIAKVAFGFQTSVQMGENPELFRLVKSIFGANTFWGNIFSTMSTIFPEMKPLWRLGAQLRTKLSPLPFFVLNQKLRKVIAFRKAEKPEVKESRLHDFIDMMLELEAEASWDGAKGQTGDSMLRVAKKLTGDEIVANMMVILIAGYETTSIALAFLAFHLAAQPDIQEQLYAELKGAFKSEKDVDHDGVAKLAFLDHVVNEGLRLYPHGSIVVNRKCMVATSVGEQTIPAGMCVAADIYNVHHNPELWGDDAGEFRPSRFEEQETSARHPMAFMPFGAGPRICLGMRFALLEEKLALARLLLRFKIKHSPLAPAKVAISGNVTFGPSEVQVILEKRE